MATHTNLFTEKLMLELSNKSGVEVFFLARIVRRETLTRNQKHSTWLGDVTLELQTAIHVSIPSLYDVGEEFKCPLGRVKILDIEMTPIH